MATLTNRKYNTILMRLIDYAATDLSDCRKFFAVWEEFRHFELNKKNTNVMEVWECWAEIYKNMVAIEADEAWITDSTRDHLMAFIAAWEDYGIEEGWLEGGIILRSKNNG